MNIEIMTKNQIIEVVKKEVEKKESQMLILINRLNNQIIKLEEEIKVRK